MNKRIQVIPLDYLLDPPPLWRRLLSLQQLRANLFPPAQPNPLLPLWTPTPPQERLNWQAAVPGFIGGVVGTGVVLCLYFLL